jgi:hypothetical protein
MFATSHRAMSLSRAHFGTWKKHAALLGRSRRILQQGRSWSRLHGRELFWLSFSLPFGVVSFVF